MTHLWSRNVNKTYLEVLNIIRESTTRATTTIRITRPPTTAIRTRAIYHDNNKNKNDNNNNNNDNNNNKNDNINNNNNNNNIKKKKKSPNDHRYSWETTRNKKKYVLQFLRFFRLKRKYRQYCNKKLLLLENTCDSFVGWEKMVKMASEIINQETRQTRAGVRQKTPSTDWKWGLDCWTDSALKRGKNIGTHTHANTQTHKRTHTHHCYIRQRFSTLFH